jgi:hypothetical protein
MRFIYYGPRSFGSLQSKLFSRQIFLLYFGKGNFGGKKFTLQRSLFDLLSDLYRNHTAMRTKTDKKNN